MHTEIAAVAPLHELAGRYVAAFNIAPHDESSECQRRVYTLAIIVGVTGVRHWYGEGVEDELNWSYNCGLMMARGPGQTIPPFVNRQRSQWSGLKRVLYAGVETAQPVVDEAELLRRLAAAEATVRPLQRVRSLIPAQYKPRQEQ